MSAASAPPGPPPCPPPEAARVLTSSVAARRFETLEPEMNNLASRVAAVNRIADQLLATDQRNQESIRATREQLNARWGRPGGGGPGTLRGLQEGSAIP